MVRHRPSRLATSLLENFFDGVVGEGRVARMIVWTKDLVRVWVGLPNL